MSIEIIFIKACMFFLGDIDSDLENNLTLDDEIHSCWFFVCVIDVLIASVVFQLDERDYILDFFTDLFEDGKFRDNMKFFRWVHASWIDKHTLYFRVLDFYEDTLSC